MLKPYGYENDIKINVVTCTYGRKGVEVIAKALSQQTFKEFNWILVDKQYDLGWFDKYIKPYNLNVIYIPDKIRPQQKPNGWNNARNTAKMYFNAELIVEIEDHMWVGKDALLKFWEIYKTYPSSIVSAVFSMCSPESMKVFLEKDQIKDDDVEIIDYTVRPKDIGIVLPQYCPGWNISRPYVGYEGNVCSYPLSLIETTGLWDEKMDNHLGFNGNQVAIEAILRGYLVLIDTTTKYYYIEHKENLKDENGQLTDFYQWQGRDVMFNNAYLEYKYGDRIRQWSNIKILIAHAEDRVAQENEKKLEKKDQVSRPYSLVDIPVCAGSYKDKFIVADTKKMQIEHNLDKCFETGTYLGSSTKELAKIFPHVYSTELNRNHYMTACKELHNVRNVTLLSGESFHFLDLLLQEGETGWFFFLDAHWFEQKPLFKELEAITKKKLINPVICIHDFQVPDKPEMGYDPDWGTIEHVHPYMTEIYGEYDVYYPEKVDLNTKAGYAIFTKK